MPQNYEPRLWAQLADEARTVAKQVRDQGLKLHVLLVAARYLVWSKRAARDEAAPHRRSASPNDPVD